MSLTFWGRRKSWSAPVFSLAILVTPGVLAGEERQLKKLHATAALMLPPTMTNYEWAGRPTSYVGSTSPCYPLKVPFGQFLKNGFINVASSYFDAAAVETVLIDGNVSHAVAYAYEVNKFSFATGGKGKTYDLTYSINATVDGAQVWNDSRTLQGDVEVNSWADIACVHVPILLKHIETSVVDSLRTSIASSVLNDSVRDAIETAQTTIRKTETDLASGLQPLLATYRVTESDGVIRKKPDAKGSTVRKLGMGSIVQIIGKLPSGWLQVAKEGEAIGWIHEGSVTAMSVQSQEATTVATSVPTKPTKPSPAPVAVPPAPTLAAAPAASTEAFPTKPVSVNFPRGKPAPDDIAVIIGNANYKATAKDIPDVIPAYADAEGMKRYATQALGIKEENVIFIKDARLADLIATFGNESNPKGKLWNWVKASRSEVFVFYSGHGAPSGDGASSYLVPVDATASLIDLSGYSLKTLYANLGKLPAKSVTVVLEACFSGASQSGMLVKNASPIYQKAMTETVPANLTVISAGSGNQIASWEQDKSHGLFTKHYLLGMAGAADKKPHGNGDGRVTNDELTRYLAETVSYAAQRYYGREQTAQIVTSGR